MRPVVRESTVLVYSSPKLESAADVPNMRPVVREVGFSIVGVVQLEVRALPDNELHKIRCNQCRIKGPGLTLLRGCWGLAVE